MREKTLFLIFIEVIKSVLTSALCLKLIERAYFILNNHNCKIYS